MYVKLTEINKIIPDNDARYFELLESVINSVDIGSTVEVYKKPDKYTLRLTPTKENNINLIIEEVLKFHNLMNIKLNLSKSIKTSGKIFFDIPN